MELDAWPNSRRTARAAALVASVCALTVQLSCLAAAREGPVVQQRVPPSRDAERLITASSMGRIRLGMTLDQARQALGPTAVLSRTSDGDGAALVAVTEGPEDMLTLWANEDDPATPIDWARPIEYIQTFNAAFQTAEGVQPGALVTDVVRIFGPVTEIVASEIESRQFITFARQPSALTFRLDYTGIFAAGTRRTTQFSAEAKILSIAISSQDQR
jgi:hypothetical protein